jgi:hypothetical protein
MKTAHQRLSNRRETGTSYGKGIPQVTPDNIPSGSFPAAVPADPRGNSRPAAAGAQVRQVMPKPKQFDPVNVTPEEAFEVLQAMPEGERTMVGLSKEIKKQLGKDVSRSVLMTWRCRHLWDGKIILASRKFTGTAPAMLEMMKVCAEGMGHSTLPFKVQPCFRVAFTPKSRRVIMSRPANLFPSGFHPQITPSYYEPCGIELPRTKQSCWPKNAMGGDQPSP